MFIFREGFVLCWFTLLTLDLVDFNKESNLAMREVPHRVENGFSEGFVEISFWGDQLRQDFKYCPV